MKKIVLILLLLFLYPVTYADDGESEIEVEYSTNLQDYLGDIFIGSDQIRIGNGLTIYFNNRWNGKIKERGEIMEKSYVLDSFDELIIRHDYEVSIVQGDAFQVVVTTDNDTMDDLSIIVDDHILTLDYEKGVVVSNPDIFVVITMPELARLTLENDVVVKVEAFESNSLDIKMINDALLKGQITASEVIVHLENDTNITLDGLIKTLDLLAYDESHFNVNMVDGFVKCADESYGKINVSSEVEIVATDESMLRICGKGQLKIIRRDEDVIIRDLRH